MGRKRAGLSKKFGYKKGNIPSNKGKKMAFEAAPEPEPFMRLPHSIYESRVTENGDNVLQVHDVDQSPTSPMLLRPQPKSPELIDEYSNPKVCNPDNHTYKHYVPSLLSVMWNATIKEHILQHPLCNGDLEFDCNAAVKWGFAWKERLKCVKCGFIGKFHKLYYEVDSDKRGRKAATINIGLQAGLMTTSISNKSFREISLTCNIIPAQLSGMQRLTNKVGSMVVDLNRQDLKDIRESIVVENELVGYSNPRLVNVETDARYNNPLYNSDATAFQAGTQVVQTMAENNTKSKRIISVYTGNKLCLVASRLRNKGENVECPNHTGHCTANLTEQFAIGNESEHTKHCTLEINDSLQIDHLTSDGDSKALNGVKKAQHSKVKALRDVRHLANSMKRAVQNCTFSPNMFTGKNKRNLKHRFVMDLKARCVAELNAAFKMHKNELFKVKNQMPSVVNAIIKCYKGDCGIACQIDSYVCAGKQSNHWKKSYLPSNEGITMTPDDEAMLRNSISVLLGPKSLDLVRYLTSTQKCEAFNRTLQRCNPKIVTHARNFPGRVHTAVHLNNHRFGNSTLLRTKALGAELTQGSSVIRHLKKCQETDVKHINRKRSKECKLKRAMTRQRKYDLHAAINYKNSYRKGLIDPKLSSQNM